jgi:hypothetical protein
MFKLVSVEDPTLVVAVQERMKEANKIAGFGDIYRGVYIVAEEGAPFEYFGNVVAKKNKVSDDGSKPDEDQHQEVC